MHKKIKIDKIRIEKIKHETNINKKSSNLHPNKQKYKSEKETLYFYYTK